MLANEASGSEIPDLGYVFDRVESLAGQFSGSKSEIAKGIGLIKNLWNTYDKKTVPF